MSTFSEFTISLMVNNIISAQQLNVVGPLGSERIKIQLLVKIPNKLGDNQMPFLFNRCGKWPTTYYKRRTAGCRQHVSTQIKRRKFKDSRKRQTMMSECLTQPNPHLMTRSHREDD